VELNQEFLIETFFSFCKRPIHKKYQNVFNSECPICKEGKSAGRSRRLFYFPSKQYFYCHNCVKSWRPFEWVKEVTGWTFPEIVNKNKEKADGEPKFKTHSVVERTIEIPDLPENSIDLTDQSQINFFENNKYVKLALEYCEKRRLFRAINSCKRFYLSLEDRVHKNRLVIPFYGDNNKVTCYQTRALTSNQFPKYLTKFGEKELFGITNVDASIPYVFVFEGPIDSMFVKNGVALASLAPTAKQIQQLNNLIGYEQIWVFDNDKNNKQTSQKILKYINEGKKIFLWPKEFYRFKDFNEICCSLELDEISWKFVVKNSVGGQEAMLKYKLTLASNFRGSQT
jgi:DNA primase